MARQKIYSKPEHKYMVYKAKKPQIRVTLDEKDLIYELRKNPEILALLIRNKDTLNKVVSTHDKVVSTHDKVVSTHDKVVSTIQDIPVQDINFDPKMKFINPNGPVVYLVNHLRAAGYEASKKIKKVRLTQMATQHNQKYNLKPEN